MPSYAALLGHMPLISRAELLAVLPDLRETHVRSKQFFCFETHIELSQDAFDTLGGSIVLAQRISGDSLSLQDIPSVLKAELDGMKGKATFSLRTEGMERSKVRELYRLCKDHLKEHGIASRYIGNERSPALPIQLRQQGLLEGKGCELVIIRDKNSLWVGRTIAAQDSEAYTLRDIEKPVRDTLTGLLPPKLAQIMLNFGAYLIREKTGTHPDAPTVFDPFCGSGVIPMEALVRGWPVLGSDVSQKAVNGCTKNVEWIRKTYGIGKREVPATIWKQDARKPFDLKALPDVVVSETTLGPALKKRANVKESESLRRDAETIEQEFLRNAASTLPGVPLVVTWPAWYTKNRPLLLEKTPALCDELGYVRILPPGVDPGIPGRVSLLYRRPDQFVGREIVLLQPR